MDTRKHTAAVQKHVEPIEELSVVRLSERLNVSAAHALPKGALGTVVSVYGGGQAYDVEFEEPVHALVTLTPDKFVAVPEASRGRVIAASKHFSDRRG